MIRLLTTFLEMLLSCEDSIIRAHISSMLDPEPLDPVCWKLYTRLGSAVDFSCVCQEQEHTHVNDCLPMQGGSTPDVKSNTMVRVHRTVQHNLGQRPP